MSTASTCAGLVVSALQPRRQMTVREFLDSVNPDDLAAAALEHTGGLGGPTVGESFLMALKKMAEDMDA